MSDAIWARLAAPFPPEAIHWRVGRTVGGERAMVLAYLQSRDVMDRLDAVVGPANWQCKYPIAADKTICELSVRVDGEWITKSDGAGDTKVEGEKGAISDALKRAAVLFGVGRYLYRLGSTYADMDGKKIAKSAYKELRDQLREQAWEINPVTGDRMDVNGNSLMSREDVIQLTDACEMQLDAIKDTCDVDHFDAFMVVRDMLHDTPYQGLRTDQFSILPKTLGIELSAKVSQWNPRDTEDF